MWNLSPLKDGRQWLVVPVKEVTGVVCLSPCLFLFRFSLYWMSCLSLTHGHKKMQRSQNLIMHRPPQKKARCSSMTVKFISAVLHGSKTTCIHFAVHTCRTIIEQRWQERNGSFKAKLKVRILLFYVKWSKVARITFHGTVLWFTHAARDDDDGVHRDKRNPHSHPFPTGW